jgi:prepilin-type N-terminal cleavage/methylation domain-containing protein
MTASARQTGRLPPPNTMRDTASTTRSPRIRQMPRASMGRRGFTLIELLVVTAIVGVVSAAIVGCFAAGIRLWDTARSFGHAEGQATLALLEAERDLRNAIPLSMLTFVGAADAVTIPALVRNAAAPAGGRRAIGSIRYRYDRATGSLLKQSWIYPAAPPAEGEGVTVAEGLEAFTCRYRATPAAEWREGWEDPTNLPARVSLALVCTSGTTRIVLQREIHLPLGGDALGGAEEATP